MVSQTALRRVFFRIMLMALAAAAVAGFFAVLLASYDVVGRVAATAFATALASGMMWRIESLLNKQTTSASGMLGMAATGLCFLIALPAIWVEDQELRCWGTLLAISLTSPAAMGCLQLIAWQRGRTAGKVGIVFTSAVLLAWLYPLWIVPDAGENWFGTVLTLAGFGTLITLCLVNATLTVRSSWRWVGVLCAALACMITLALVWSNFSGTGFRTRLVTVLSSVAVVIVHANLLLLISLKRTQQWVRTGTIASAIWAASCLDILIVGELRGDNLMARLTCAMAIVAGCGTLALVVLDRYNRLTATQLAQANAVGDAQSLETITVHCPRCSARQTITLGGAQCAKCGLQIHVQVCNAI